MFTPLTPEQYQSARNAGFTHDQIVTNEQRRKSESGITPSQPEQPQSFIQKAMPESPLGGSIFDAGVGALKSYGKTFIESPVRSVAGIFGAASTIGKDNTSNMNQALTEAEKSKNLVAQIQSTTDPAAKVALQQKLREGSQSAAQLSTSIAKENQPTQTAMNVYEGKTGFNKAFEPINTAQNVGAGLGYLSQFFIPSSAVTKATTATNAVIDSSRLAKLASSPEAGPALKIISKVATNAGKIIGRSGIEALSAAGVTFAHDQNIQEAENNAKWAAYITGAVGILGLGSQFFGNKFSEAAKKIYRSAMKPSTAGVGGTERAARVVDTGLKEGIVLTESGVEQTASKIDDLETQLGQTIDASADKGGYVSTKSLKPYVDEAKALFSNIADVKEGEQGVKEIDDIYNRFVKEYGKKIPVDKAQEIKVATYQWLKKSYGKLGTATTEGTKQLVRGLKEGIVENAPEAGAINSRLKALYEFDIALDKSIGRMKNHNLLSIGTKMLGAAGEASGNSLLKVLSLANQVAGSPISKSGFAIYLNRISNLLQGASPEVIDKASPALRTLLERVKGEPYPAAKNAIETITTILGK